MTATRQAKQKDIFLIYIFIFNNVIDCIPDILLCKKRTAGLGSAWVSYKIRTSEFGKKQVKIIFFCVFNKLCLIVSVTAPGVKPD